MRPVVTKFGIGLLAASPLARGLLGGRYDRAAPPPASHALLSNKGVSYWTDQGFATLEKVRAVASQLGVSPAQIALAGILSFPEISAVLVGASSIEQLKECSEMDPAQLELSMVRTILEPP